MIVGIMGGKNAGKDTVGAYLIKEHSFERISFAHAMKQSVCNLLDIDMWDVEKFKNDPTVYVTIGHKNEPSPVQGGQPAHMWSPIREQTFREFLQHYGDEAHKPIFGEECWVDIALPVEGFYSGRSIVVTDCRFNTEVDRIKELGGIVIRVDRPGLGEQDPHRSEQEMLSITPSHILVNDGTIDDLYEKVEGMLCDF